MEEHAYRIIARVERTHWWYRARRRILHAVVRAEMRAGAPAGPVLDLGCGTGANLSVAARCGEVVGVDFSEVALGYARRTAGYAALVRGDAGTLPFEGETFGWVLALDVLEHLDDEAAMAEIMRVLRPGGRALVTVPAFPALWGAQDEAAHHLRRYTRKGLLALLRGAGLAVRRTTYLNTALFVPVLLARRAIRLLRIPVESENTLHPGWANPLLERIFGAEAHLVPYVSLPFGVSLLCVAERPPTEPSPPNPRSDVRHLRIPG